ncbi:FlgB family protein [Paracoccus beibuensis]|uniref:FlgB family protein n=1 Tax=Paracoccus beibuensis TaxID=547602 RepID=UPI00223FACFB|nr:FlgB family protein [Paracoccus beibuensis]
MFEKIEMMRMARAMGQHVADRQVAVTRNIVNADTPGYRASDLQPFAESYELAASGGGGLRTTDPRHMAAPQWSPAGARLMQTTDPISPNGNSVSLEEEMVRAADVKRQHDLSLGIYRSALDLMQASLGRR